jgi:hypothetical protein
MRNSNYFFIAIAFCTLGMASCQKDNLTENIRLDESKNVIDASITTRSLRGDEFKFNELVVLTADDAVVGGGSEGGGRSGKGNLDGFGKGQANMAITGIGDSRIQNWGSWYVEVDLIYDPTQNEVYGSITITYPDYGDAVNFSVSGQPAIVLDRDDNSQYLNMQLDIAQGSGRFENKAFTGSAMFPSVGSLIDGTGDLRTYLEIDGMLIDNPRNRF